MILSDKDIRKKINEKAIVVKSADNRHETNINASSLDLRLGRFFRIFNHSQKAILDPMDPESFVDATKLIEIKDPGEPFIIQPGEFVLGVTMEHIEIADDLVARVEGRSSLGRLGIIIHSTAGFVDAGFKGTITLEITNINRMPVALYPGMRVCQLAFEGMSSVADVPYSSKKTSKYQNQELPQESKLTNDPELIKMGIERSTRGIKAKNSTSTSLSMH